MALELQYLGQNTSLFGPDLALVGDPSIDNPALQAAGYVAGTLVVVKTSTVNPDGVAIAPADGASADTTAPVFGAIITEPGEFANTIGPSASNRIAVARQQFVGNIYAGSNTTASYVASPTPAYAAGLALYLANGATGTWTTTKGTASTLGATPVGICTHAPTTTEPWLGVASLV